MSLEISINRIVYTKLAQLDPIVNDLIYKAPIDGLYRISIYGFIPVHSLVGGQAVVTWNVPLFVPDYPGVNASIKATLQVTSTPGEDAAGIVWTMAYLKAGQSLFLNASTSNGAPPAAFDTHVCVEPLQAV